VEKKGVPAESGSCLLANGFGGLECHGVCFSSSYYYYFFLCVRVCRFDFRRCNVCSPPPQAGRLPALQVGSRSQAHRFFFFFHGFPPSWFFLISLTFFTISAAERPGTTSAIRSQRSRVPPGKRT
jgi:hypothetical protein